jgi:YafQ family addiction module toxin component
MYNIVFSHRFKKERKKYGGSGRASVSAIDAAIDDLRNCDTVPLDPRYKDHSTKHPFDDCRDMHAEPDTVIIYRIEGEDLTLVRVGSHADLFKPKGR